MHDILTDTALVQLVERIYAAGCEPGGWQAFVDHVHGELPGAICSILLRVTGVGGISGLTAGIPEEHLKSYFAHYHTINPYTPIFDKLETGKVYTVTGLGSRQWLHRHEFYHEWLKPVGDLTHGASTLIARDARRTFRITFDIGARYADLEDVCARLLTRIGPHLTRAFEVNERLRGATATEAALAGLLDRIDGAALMLGADAHVLALNRRAEALARSGRLYRIARPGRLAFRHPDDDAGFRRALAVALGSLSHAAPMAFAARKADPAPVTILVLPLRPAGGGAALGVALPRALLIVQPAKAATLPKDLLKALYGLTNAEAGIVLRVAAGASVAEAADAAGVSLTTARNQLAAAMAKVGVNRQAELVAAVAALAPRLSLEGDE